MSDLGPLAKRFALRIQMERPHAAARYDECVKQLEAEGKMKKEGG